MGMKPEQLAEAKHQSDLNITRATNIARAVPSAERLREMAAMFDYQDDLLCRCAIQLGIRMGQPGPKMQRELRKLADAMDKVEKEEEK